MSGISLLTAVTVFPDVVSDYAVGRQGDALKHTLRQYCSPESLMDVQSSESQSRALLMELQTDGSDHIVDMVTGNAYRRDEAVVALARCNIVGDSWLGLPVDYRHRAPYDLFNSMLTVGDILACRRSGEGFSEVPGSSGGRWCTGSVTLDGWTMDVVEPADSQKGMIARRYFYFTTIYPFSIWGGDGVKFFTSEEYPGLTSWASSVYLSWHRQYPVTDIEIKANDASERLQGNRNPFVDYPDLAEYLWGSHVGEIYPGNGSVVAPDTPDDVVVRIPLRGRYKLSSDRWLDLYSPYVDEDAKWSIDGMAQTEVRIALDGIGLGKHELQYATPGSMGKLIIYIEP